MRAKTRTELFMLSVVVAAVHTLVVETPQKKVEVERGHDVTVPCTFQSSGPMSPGDFVSWTKVSTLTEIISKYFDNGQEMSGQAYKNRVAFASTANDGDVSIILSTVTMADNGTYECSVRLRQDLPMKNARIDLVVLVAPSVPDCKIVGTPQYGHNINLTCHSQEGSPAPTYSWQSFSVENKPRPLVGAAAAGGLLMLKNVSADTSGYYICTSSNTVSMQSCNITVGIVPPSMNIALYAGIAGGSIAAVIIIGIVAYFCCCRNRKDKDYEMTEQDDAYQPPQKEPVRIRGPVEETQEEEAC